MNLSVTASLSKELDLRLTLSAFCYPTEGTESESQSSQGVLAVIIVAQFGGEG